MRKESKMENRVQTWDEVDEGERSPAEERIISLLAAIEKGNKADLIAFLHTNYLREFGANAYKQAMSDYTIASHRYTPTANGYNPYDMLKFAKALNCNIFLQAFGYIKNGQVKGQLAPHPDGRDDVGPCDFVDSFILLDQFIAYNRESESYMFRHYLRSMVFCGRYIFKIKNYVNSLSTEEAWYKIVDPVVAQGGFYLGEPTTNEAKICRKLFRREHYEKEKAHCKVVYANTLKGDPILRDIAALERARREVGEGTTFAITIKNDRLVEIMACLKHMPEPLPVEVHIALLAPYFQLVHPFAENGCAYENIMPVEGGFALRYALCQEQDKEGKSQTSSH